MLKPTREGQDSVTVTGATKEGKDQIQQKATSPQIAKIDRQRSHGRSFSTSPKMRRHVSKFLSYQRLLSFMEHLWETGLRKTCSYGTLRFEWEGFSGTNDRRTVERYLGRPKHAVRSCGRSTVTRLNRTSGKIAQFEYMNTKYVPEKKGLAQRFGFITFMKVKPNHYPNEDARLCFLHHETFPYFTEQVTLSSLQEAEEVGASIDDVCVSPLYSQRSGSGAAKGNVEAADSIERKDEEEAIDGTHTDLVSSVKSQHSLYAKLYPQRKAQVLRKTVILTDLESRILQSASEEGG